MIPQDIINNLLNAVEELKCNITATECWVAMGESRKDRQRHWVYVGDEPYALNGTQFAVITPVMATRAIHFESREQAEKYGFNYYLKDGDDKPIQMVAVRLSEFAQEMLKEAEWLIETFQNANLNASKNL